MRWLGKYVLQGPLWPVETQYMGRLDLVKIIRVRYEYLIPYNPYLPTPPLEEDKTQGQFLSGV